jgi:hypothetical protein
MIARRPAALSFRFFRLVAGPDFDSVPDSFREAAHRALCAAPIRFLAAADIFRLGLADRGAVLTMDPAGNICRSSAI